MRLSQDDPDNADAEKQPNDDEDDQRLGGESSRRSFIPTQIALLGDVHQDSPNAHVGLGVQGGVAERHYSIFHGLVGDGQDALFWVKFQNLSFQGAVVLFQFGFEHIGRCPQQIVKGTGDDLRLTGQVGKVYFVQGVKGRVHIRAGIVDRRKGYARLGGNGRHLTAQG